MGRKGNKYHKLESFNCWVDIEKICVYSTITETGEPDLENPKYLNEIDPSWFVNLGKEDKEFIANLMNKKE